MNTLDTRTAAERVKACFMGLSHASLDRLGDIYGPHAYFRDPFSEVRGLPAIRAVYARMFEHLDDCRFTFRDTVVDEGGALLTWDLAYRIRKWRPQELRTIHGASHLRFDAAGRIIYHRDYWDVAEELYAKLPVIGPVVRWLQRRLG